MAKAEVKVRLVHFAYEELKSPLMVGRVGLEPTTHGLALVPVLLVSLVKIFSSKPIISGVLLVKSLFRINRLNCG